MLRIAFIGFGEAARAWCGSLDIGEALSVTAFDILLATSEREAFEAAAENLNVTLVETPSAAVDQADIVISAVTASESLAAARSVSEALRPGQVFVDINSVSPERKRATARLLEPQGAEYVDMAVMAPVHPAGHRTPVLVAGEFGEGFRARLDELGFSYDIVSEETGAATAIKMIRSLFVKGLEAVTVQALLAAEEAGCYDRIFASLSKSFAALGWPEFPAYQFERVTRHGERRAAEMRECAASMADLGLADGSRLADAIAAVHDSIGAAGVRLDPQQDPQSSADTLLKALRQ